MFGIFHLKFQTTVETWVTEMDTGKEGTAMMPTVMFYNPKRAHLANNMVSISGTLHPATRLVSFWKLGPAVGPREQDHGAERGETEECGHIGSIMH